MRLLAVPWRLTAVMLCVSPAPLVFGQSPVNKTQTKPPVNETRAVNQPQIGILVPRISTIPSLFGMNRNEVARLLEPLHLQPKFIGPDNGIVVAQEHRSVELAEGSDFFAWARETWAPDRYTVLLDPYQQSPWRPEDD